MAFASELVRSSISKPHEGTRKIQPGKSPTFVFAGGGTGGHLFPGIAVAAELRQRLPTTRVLFVGSERDIESKIVAEHGLEHRILPVEPLPTLKRNPFRFVLKNWRAMRAAFQVLKELHPSAVVGLGGYASAPLVWAAKRSSIPVILLEQNVIPGRTTRWLSRYATQVCVSFAETRSRLPNARSVIVTGNPVRAEIAALFDRLPTELRSSSDFANKPELLILGGSQGADSLNQAVLLAIEQIHYLVSDWQIVHQTGPRLVEIAREAYRRLGLSAVVEPFFHDLSARYSNAALVVSRAGATTLAELACVGLPMILLPYPLAADDHQQANAEVFVDQSAAILVRHSSTAAATANELTLGLRQLVVDGERRKALGRAAKQFAYPHAALKIADVIVAATNTDQVTPSAT